MVGLDIECDGGDHRTLFPGDLRDRCRVALEVALHSEQQPGEVLKDRPILMTVFLFPSLAEGTGTRASYLSPCHFYCLLWAS